MTEPSYLKASPQTAADVAHLNAVQETVTEVIAAVRERGDEAVREYSERFDRWSPESFRLGPEEVERIVAAVPAQVVGDIRTVQANVRSFAQRQLESMAAFEVETQPGVFRGKKHLPIAATGAYVPGGRYPLTASAHMTVVTAKVAGVQRVTACTPPIRGEVPAATVAAMHLAGADEVLLLGGVQAVAAMAIGTETIGKVDLLAGPGNAYVAEAKRQLFGEVGIDLFAGPTEILVVADDGADPFVVAVDLLSQAEHGPDSPAVLITTSEDVAHAALAHVERLLPGVPTNDMGRPRRALEQMRNYGALFLGEGTCVSYGDKVIGTNHVLPTRGAARYTGGLWVGKYLRTVTYQEVTNTESSAALGELCGRASRVELFEGHARSGDVRAAKYAGADLPWAPASSPQMRA